MQASPDIRAFAAGFPDFVIHLGVAFGLFAGALTIYTLLTPQKELALVREGNPSASLAYGGVIVGLAIPLGACLANATSLLDLIIWSIITLLVQLFAFRIADMVLRGLPKRIVEGDVAAAVFLMSVKLALALIVSGAIQDPNLAMLRAS